MVIESESQLERDILEFLPWDKSWLIRMAFLDLVRGYGPNDFLAFLATQENLGEDVEAMGRVALNWNKGVPLDVGESGTVFRAVYTYQITNGIDLPIITHGSLTDRVARMKLPSDLARWSLKERGTLEGGTTQWQTMALLMGSQEQLEELPFYLQKTVSSIKHHNEKRAKGEIWQPQKDPTLLTQCLDYASFIRGEGIRTVPTRLGDCDLYCFLRAFDYVEREWAEKNWPQLAEHESNRFDKMETTLEQLNKGNIIETKDHRVVQAEAMLLQSRYPSLNVKEIRKRFTNPDCVNKTWKLFWQKVMPYFGDYALSVSR